MAHLVLNQPKIFHDCGKYRVTCDVTEIKSKGFGELEHINDNIWIDVDELYGQYMVDEVCDAFVVAVLPYAFFNNLNIHVKIMSAELYHNISHQLLPALSKYNPSIYDIEIIVERLVDISYEGTNVGTGVSMGVDSFDVIYSYYESIDCRLSDFKISSLVVNNVGGFNISKFIPDNVVKSIESISEELGLPVLYLNSNLHLWRRVDFLLTHAFNNIFSVLALGKYWKKYYYATGYEVSEFNISMAHRDTTYYELLLLKCLSCNSLTFISPNLEKSRLDKTRSVSESSIARKYLNSCLINVNCGFCDKCLRNIINLDACSKLYLFEEIIKLDHWKNNREDILLELIHDKDDPSLRDAYDVFRVENKYNFDKVESKYARIVSKYSDYPDSLYAYLSLEKGSRRCIKKLISLYNRTHDYNLNHAIAFFRDHTTCESHPYRDNLYFDILYRRGTPEDLLIAKKIIESSVKNGDSGASLRLGRMYRDGKGVENDVDKAITLIRKAADKKYGWSRNELIDMLSKRGTAKDFIEMKRIAEVAAEEGDTGAMGRLGRMYRDGKGVEKDLDKAIMWMRKAAEKNSSWRNEFIDVLWKCGTAKDFIEIKSIAEVAAEEGDTGAMGRLGRMYRDGKGVEKDLDKAIMWMRKAAEKWHGWSRNELVDLLSKRGALDDFIEMKNVVEITIERGMPEVKAGAMGRLGRMYRDGKGVEKDLDKAVYWMERAAKETSAWDKEIQVILKENK